MPERSRALFIGVDKFQSLDDLPAVRRNLSTLVDLFAQDVWGLGASRCMQLLNPASVREVDEAIFRAAEEASDTLLLYYAGHGLLDRKGCLHLALPDSSTRSVHSTAFPYDWVRMGLSASRAQRCIVILDCCFSARAMGLQSSPSTVVELAEAEGTYVIAAAAENAVALAPPGETYTAFTGALVGVLTDGIAEAPEFLDLDTVFMGLQSVLRRQGRPDPQCLGRNQIGRTVFVKNPAHVPDQGHSFEGAIRELHIARTTQAVEMAGPHDSAPWLFARCWMRVTRYETITKDPTDIDAALNDFDDLPADLPGRAKLAAVLATALIRSGELVGSARMPRAMVLVDIADADPSPLAGWPATSAALRAADLLVAWQQNRPGFSPPAALQELERYARIVGDTQPHATLIDAARMGLQHLVIQDDMDPAAAQRLAEDVRAFTDGLDSRPPLFDRGKVMALLQEANAKAMRGDPAGAMEKLEELREGALRLPVGDPLRMAVDEAWNQLVPFLDMLQPVAPAGEDQLLMFSEMAAQPGIADNERALRLSQLGAAELATDTPQSVDSAVKHLTEALSVATEHDPRRTYYLMFAGVAHLRRVEMTGDRRDLRTGTDLLEQAWRQAESSTHALWTTTAMPLAHAYRLAGRNELGRSTALSGLRGHAWSVLLQSTPDEMQATARDAAGDALDTARLCLMDHDPEGAATALDAGRGLILYATTETRGLEARLTAAGDATLAREWAEAQRSHLPDDVPGELRRRVIGALAGVELTADGSPAASPGQGTTRLLDPPQTRETSAALRALGMDALVYLVPGDERNGAAVVIPADAPPSWCLLPKLNDTGFAAFGSFLFDAAQGMEGADAHTCDSALLGARNRAPQVLDEICEWAWEAAIGPLVERHLDLPADRPARLVLVPVRELARVPWHAARTRSADGTWRYAMERVVFSYAPSARLLCESAWHDPVPLTTKGLVVGDPDTAGRARDLPAARLEALAIKDCFYPDARYVGRLPDGEPSQEGAGTCDEVLRWLADPDGGTMMHLACHGIVEQITSARDSSYLLLDGGEHLAAERLVLTLGAGPDRGIALAVLAACSSGRSGRGYDEAFSLSTTLLVGRVRSVVSSAWSVPDEATSVLMFMFHHFLKEEALAPADALRTAQLCMVRRREPPGAMPHNLRRYLHRHGEGITSWAAFMHTGR
ncbi:caspase, EACC1-associated type [Streptomyces sp. NPDC002817]|uniref:caspase, EACC1-associated type n=1 Tax=Streptomyces sp. NPDC088357 TaxID=3154655 RepID=UPI00342B4A38